MKRLMMGIVVAAGLVAFGSTATLAQSRPYTYGTVTNVTAVKVKPGKFDAYMNHLSTRWKVQMEEAKKQGLVVSYSVQGTQPRTANDPDVYLVVTYPNMATFDGLGDKMDVISKKLFNNTPEQMAQQSAERSETMREIMGSEMIREIVFK